MRDSLGRCMAVDPDSFDEEVLDYDFLWIDRPDDECGRIYRNKTR